MLAGFVLGGVERGELRGLGEGGEVQRGRRDRGGALDEVVGQRGEGTGVELVIGGVFLRGFERDEAVDQRFVGPGNSPEVVRRELMARSQPSICPRARLISCHCSCCPFTCCVNVSLSFLMASSQF